MSERSVVDGSRDVVVGLDGSLAGWVAWRWAVDEARCRGTKLRIVHAVNSAALGRFGIDQGPMSVQLLMSEAVRQAETRGAVAVAHVIHAPPVRALLTESANAALAVVGASGLEMLRDDRVGSTAAALARESSVPVVTVPAGWATSPLPGAPVVVGLDDHGSSLEALRFATAEAALHGWPVTAVHARTRIPAPATQRLRACVGSRAGEVERAAQIDAMSAWVDAPCGPITALVADSEPMSALLEASRSAALLVVGRRPAAERDTPSVSDFLVRRSSCPVVAVPNGGVDDRPPQAVVTVAPAD
jgi:nucleotide-binding universal stress UspA family protein